MADPFSHYLVPNSENEAIEVLQTAQVTYAFYDEVRYREALEQYCEWYQAIAAQHSHELETMRREVNLFRWFVRRGNH